MSDELKDLSLRAFKTFVQAGIAVLAVSDDATSTKALAAAAAAGASLAWNKVIAPSKVWQRSGARVIAWIVAKVTKA